MLKFGAELGKHWRRASSTTTSRVLQFLYFLFFLFSLFFIALNISLFDGEACLIFCFVEKISASHHRIRSRCGKCIFHQLTRHFLCFEFSPSFSQQKNSMLSKETHPQSTDCDNRGKKSRAKTHDRNEIISFLS